MAHSALSTSSTSYGGPSKPKTNPRNTKIDMFIVHHAADTVLQNVKNIFAQDGGRGTSANYIVCDDQIIASVPEELRAWTGGGKRDGAIMDGSVLDRRAITVETINATRAPGWTISDASFESLARLIEDCSRRYDFPLNRNHVIGHGEMLTRFRAGFATACPGGISVDALVARAQEIRTAAQNAGIPTKPVEEVDMADYSLVRQTNDPVVFLSVDRMTRRRIRSEQDLRDVRYVLKGVKSPAGVNPVEVVDNIEAYGVEVVDVVELVDRIADKVVAKLAEASETA